MSMGFAFVSVLLVYFGKLAVILYYGVFARVYVTELGLLRGNFQCPLGQQFTVVIYVCTFTCACDFTLPSVWGILLSFLFFLRVCRASCSVWSSLLFLSPHCAVMWYSWVGPFVCGFFQVFSGPPCDLHPIASSIIWGFSGSHNGFIRSIEFTSKQDHGHGGPCTSTFPTDFRLNALCRQPCASGFQYSSFSSFCSQCCFQLSNGCCQLTCLHFRYIETTSICVYVHHHFHHQQLLLGWPCSIDHCSNYGITCFQPLFGSDSLASLCDKALVVGPGHAPFPVKLVKNY